MLWYTILQNTSDFNVKKNSPRSEATCATHTHTHTQTHTHTHTKKKERHTNRHWTTNTIQHAVSVIGEQQEEDSTILVTRFVGHK